MFVLCWAAFCSACGFTWLMSHRLDIPESSTNSTCDMIPSLRILNTLNGKSLHASVTGHMVPITCIILIIALAFDFIITNAEYGASYKHIVQSGRNVHLIHLAMLSPQMPC